MKKLFKVFIFISILISHYQIFGQTKNYEIWYKFSPEFTLIKHKFEFKLRPCDMTLTPAINAFRVDLAFGYTLGNFKIYEYTKFDNNKTAFTGFKLDYNLFLVDKKLLLHFQERFFWGLNKNSTNHYYLVDMATWQFTKNFSFGYLAYGKWKTDKKFNEGLWFMGAISIFKLPANFELQLAFTRDIFHKYYMPLGKISYKLKLH